MDSFVFSKMHGAGNDFIVTDMTEKDHSPLTKDLSSGFISRICDRHRGIGADGMILILPPTEKALSGFSAEQHLFRMKYFNSDGQPAGMCGNGLRCASLYAGKYLLNYSETCFFETDAGILQTEILSEEKIRIQIPILEPPKKIKIGNRECFTANTGVPHLVVPVPDIVLVDVVTEGRKLRYCDCFFPAGVNVDFVQIPERQSDPVLIRTYERGVEYETSACGTGIAAAALSLGVFYAFSSPIDFMTEDKDIITIDFSSKDNIVKEIQDILLTGPSEEVFRGELNRKILEDVTV